MTEEEYKKHIDEIKEFLYRQHTIYEQYKIVALGVVKETLKFLTEDVVEPNKLSGYLIQYLVYDSAGKYGNTSPKNDYRMKLVTVYLQGLFVARDLILEGNYNKASAVLKQDVEMVARLSELAKSKTGKLYKQPHLKFAPPIFGKLYGRLNDIAHISKEEILEELITYRDKEGSGYSPVKKLDERFALELFLADSNIKLELLRLTLILHHDLFGDDEIYPKASAYFHLLTQLVKTVVIVSRSKKANG
ncbi:MAG: hypothetical protein K0Q79_1566 [Flavipsychrobacter sp.]|jgi:hypothetical protein|nr:hypothetical protein [Flavipsychrobacter sp.]